MKNFKQDILRCKNVCEKELKERKEGIKGESSIEQIEKVIIPELDEIIDILDGNRLPPKDERFLNSFANAFTVWGWNMQSPTELFLILNKLNDDYKEI